MEHSFLSVYAAKSMEYLLAISYLLLFIPFWKYVQGGTRQPALRTSAEAQPATARAAARPPRPRRQRTEG